MSSQSHNPQLAKSHRSYTVEEIADLYSIHKNTVREWIKNGLEVCDSKRPTLVKGSVLKEFLSRRRLSKKRPCLPDEMYCLKCRSPKKPAGEMADYYPKTPELGNLVGICPDCETLMNRRTSLAKLPLIQAHLQVTFSQATPHNHKLAGPFGEPKEAFNYIKESYDDLVAAWDGVKARENIKKTDVRGKGNKARTGENWRNGKNVTPEQFAEQFGFRGVEFGNWVSQGQGNKDRQGLLNQAYDGLMDLASIVGIPPKAISLNGSLGLAFGSRGKGWAAAHFEPGNLVINLTKTKGAGSLAHEWFHALDNYFSRMRGGEIPIERGLNAQEAYRRQNYITYRPEPLYVHKTQPSKGMTAGNLRRYRELSKGSNYYAEENWQKDPKHPNGVRPEVESAFAAVVEALDASPMNARSKGADKGNDGYWSRIIERAARSFENYIIHKMRLNGYDNEYLANVTSPEDFPRNAEIYPYLLETEIQPVADAFDTLFSTIQTKETEKGVALFNSSDRMDVNGVNFATADAVVSRVVSANEKNWNVGIATFATFNDLPAKVRNDSIRQYGEESARSAKGITHDGKVYVIADQNESAADVESTILHEIEGHVGIHRLYGDDIKQKLNDLYVAIGGRKGLTKIANARGLTGDLAHVARMLGKSSFDDETRVQVMMDEALANMAQHPKFGDKVKAIVGAIRAWLRKHGFMKLAVYGETDLLNILKEGRKQLSVSKDGNGNRIAVMHAAWHGSPHDHNKFDSEHIGTGEGAQAYGWGHYFAGAREVAEWYRDKLSESYIPEFIKDGKALESAADIAEAYYQIGSFNDGYGGRDKVLDFHRDGKYRWSVQVVHVNADGSDKAGERPRWHTSMPDTKDLIKRLVGQGYTAKRGRLYQVELAPKQDEYLLWDEQLSEQSEKVQEAVRNYIDEKTNNAPNFSAASYYASDEYRREFMAKTGKQFYNDLSETDFKSDDRMASYHLNELGIRGIKYLDGNSRGKGDGQYNYVIFDDNDIEITAKFSRSGTSGRTPFAAQQDEGYIKTLNNVIALFKSGDQQKVREAGRTPVPISRTPVVLRQVMEDDGSKPFKRADFVVGQGSTLYLKADNVHSRSIHTGRISKDVLDRLPQLLADPVAVFKSSPASEDAKSFKVLLDAVDENGDPVIVAIKPNVPMRQLGNAPVNFQATIFPAKWDKVREWNKEGFLRYYNEKSPLVSRPANNPLGTASENSEDTQEGFGTNQTSVAASRSEATTYPKQ